MGERIPTGAKKGRASKLIDDEASEASRDPKSVPDVSTRSLSTSNYIQTRKPRPERETHNITNGRYIPSRANYEGSGIDERGSFKRKRSVVIPRSLPEPRYVRQKSTESDCGSASNETLKLKDGRIVCEPREKHVKSVINPRRTNEVGSSSSVVASEKSGKYGKHDQIDKNNISTTQKMNVESHTRTSLENKHEQYQCDICNLSSSSILEFEKHLKSGQHIERVLNKRNINRVDIKFYCVFCGLKTKTGHNWVTHFSGKKHLNAMKLRLPSYKPSSERNDC